MSRETRIKGGRLLLSDRIVEGDLWIRDGQIVGLGELDADATQKPAETCEIIDATGLLVMPGVIDPQVHFRDPGLTYKEDLASGSRAAAAGGVTSFLEMPNTVPNTTSFETMAAKKARAAEVSVVNYNFFIGATDQNLEVLNGVENVAGIKIFMGSSTGNLLVDDQSQLERIFGHGRRLIAVHAEDETRLKARKAAFADRKDAAAHPIIRDAEAALIATRRAVALSDRFDRRLHILHLSSGDEVAFLAEHGKGGGRISAETLPQYLLLDADEVYARLGTRVQMNPPVRGAEHRAALWAGLRHGVIDCLATDHAPHSPEEKAKAFGEAPSGMPGVETLLPVMLNAVHEGQCSLMDLGRWMCEAPARLYRMKGKGRLAVGMDADLVLVDLKQRQRVEDRGIFSKAGYSPFEGLWITGWPILTLVGGQIAYRDGAILEGCRGREIQIEDFRC